MISNERQERVATNLIDAFLSIWCDRGSDSEPYFNCGNCEFETKDGYCLAKKFAYTNHNQVESNQAHYITEPKEGEQE